MINSQRYMVLNPKDGGSSFAFTNKLSEYSEIIMQNH